MEVRRLGTRTSNQAVKALLKLASARARLRMTQSELAAALSDSTLTVSKQDISKYERDKREPPVIVLLRYSRLTNITIEVFADDHLNLPE
jgi:transcriptional regulator with XRE-family HTH domain